MEELVEADWPHPVGGVGLAREDVVEDAIAAVRDADNGTARLVRSDNMPHLIGWSRPNQPLQQTGPASRLFLAWSRCSRPRC